MTLVESFALSLGALLDKSFAGQELSAVAHQVAQL
jgi:hypothetical protein